MREVNLIYVEVMNETEQLFVFETTFNKHQYANILTLNMALSIDIQDSEFSKTISLLSNMSRKDAELAIK